jgi:tetratricopeptide (TPR) repeat protein
LSWVPRRRLYRWWKARDLERAEGTHFTVVLADLAGDDDGKQTRHVELAFANQAGLVIVRLGNTFSDPDHGHLADGRRTLEEKARDRLRDKNGDILVYGEVRKTDEVLWLRFLPRERDVAASRGDSYRLTQEKLELPVDFHGAFNDVLAAVALASIKPATKQGGRYVADLLLEPTEKTRRLLEAPPPTLSEVALATLQFFYALAALRLDEQRGENIWLTRACEAFRTVLNTWTRERVPLDWAMTQNNLGNALRRLGDRERDTARLEEAVAACRAALKEHTRERVPLQWAMTQNNLGNALSTLGERENDTARLEEAVTAFRAALKEHTRERVPLQWAMTQNNLGNALSTLGERETGTTRLEEAVTTLRAVLGEYTRERVPLQWATTQYNLGNALSRLGKLEGSTARLEEAVLAYRAALTERTRERVPLQCAMTQNNLGNALHALGERGSGTARLEEAVAAFREALEVFRAAGTSGYIDVTAGNLTDVEALLAERSAGSVGPASA